MEMGKNICDKHEFSVSGKMVSVMPSSVCDRPVIYLNTFADEGDKVYQSLCDMDCRDFTLVTVSGLLWNHDMAPWDIPPVSESDTPCTGGAEEYLQLLTEEIVPEAEKTVRGSVLWRGLAGYSLAGLFAVYSLYRTDIFSRIASISGSLWFPDFTEYVFSHEMKSVPEHIYLSLGNRECKTKNPYLRTVQTNTEAIRDFYVKKGVDTGLTLHAGGHFKNAVQRTALGIAWIIKR